MLATASEAPARLVAPAGSGCASSRLAPLRAPSPCSCAVAASLGDPARDEPAQLGVERIDEGEIPGHVAEHGETGAVVGELGAVLGSGTSPRWEPRQLSDFGDLVRREDRPCLCVTVGDAIAQLALARLVIVDRSSETDSTSRAMREPNRRRSSVRVVVVFSSTSWSSPAAMTSSGWPSQCSRQPTSIGCAMNGAWSVVRY
jgi:hypothetical protein